MTDEEVLGEGVSPDMLFQELQDLNDSLKSVQEDDGGQMSYPVPEEKESVYKFFWRVLGLDASHKVGNLRDDELGRLGLGVRNYLDLANYCDTQGWDVVAGYFRAKGEVVSATSLGRKGFFSKLFVTNIRKESKAQKLSTGDSEKGSGGWFSKRKSEDSGGDEE